MKLEKKKEKRNFAATTIKENKIKERGIKPLPQKTKLDGFVY